MDGVCARAPNQFITTVATKEGDRAIAILDEFVVTSATVEVDLSVSIRDQVIPTCPTANGRFAGEGISDDDLVVAVTTVDNNADDIVKALQITSVVDHDTTVLRLVNGDTVRTRGGVDI